MGHGLELADGQLGHLLEFIYEFDPFLELDYEVPGVSEVQHDNEDAVFEEFGLGQFAVDCRVIDLFDHVYFQFRVGALMLFMIRLSGSCMSTTLR